MRKKRGGGGGGVANLTQAGPQGRERSGLLWTLLQLRPAVSLGDNGGCGPGVWLLWCAMCVYANVCLRACLKFTHALWTTRLDLMRMLVCCYVGQRHWPQRITDEMNAWAE